MHTEETCLNGTWLAINGLLIDTTMLRLRWSEACKLTKIRHLLIMQFIRWCAAATSTFLHAANKWTNEELAHDFKLAVSYLQSCCRSTYSMTMHVHVKFWTSVSIPCFDLHGRGSASCRCQGLAIAWRIVILHVLS
jgi:hypothetical protein